MTARIAYFPFPAMPAIGAQVFNVPPGISAEKAIALTGLKMPFNTVLLRRDISETATTPAESYVPRDAWDNTLIGAGETAVLVTLPQMTAAASAIYTVIAKLASAAASMLATYFPATMATTIYGVSMTQVATAVIYVGGSVLVSSLLPSPKSYTAPNIQGQTYSLNSQANLARLGAPIPEAFGRNKIVCDLASQPWYDFVNGRQRVMQLFCIGKGYYAIKAIRAGDGIVWKNGNVLAPYSDVEIEICPPGIALTMFEDNVVTSSEVQGNEALGTNQEDHKVLGPFVGSKSGTRATKVQYDVFLQALCTVLSDNRIDPATVSWRFKAETIDDLGNPTGGVVVDEKTLTLSTKNPVRKTYEVILTGSHRWRFSFERTNDKATDAMVSDTLQWLTVRTFLPSKLVYQDVTLIAVRATGTVNLSGNALQNVNVIATRMLPIYNPASKTWSDLTPTRKIAASVSHQLRAIGGMADKNIDLALLWGALDATWEARGDTFDYQFTERKGLWQDMLEPTLGAGRTRPIPLGNKVTFVRDEPKAIYDGGMFTPHSMTPDSFAMDIDLTTGNTMDALVAAYRDQETFTDKRVLCKLPFSTATIDTAPQVEFMGCDRAQAFREGNFKLADSYYRRIRPTFTSTREGALLLPGQKAKLSHYITDFWGKSAAAETLTETDDVVTINGTTVHCDLLTLSEPWSRPVDAEGDNVITITAPDGQVYGPVPFVLIDDGTETGMATVQLMDISALTGEFSGTQPRDWPLWDADGRQKRRPRCNIGVGTMTACDIGIVTMQPTDGGKNATVGCFVDNPIVHTFDALPVPPETIVMGNTDLTITGLTIVETNVTTPEPGSPGIYGANITVVGAVDGVSFDVQWQPKDNGVWLALQPIETGKGREFSLTFAGTGLFSGACPVRVFVRAVNANGQYGSWFTAAFFADGAAEFAPDNCAAVRASRAWEKTIVEPITYTWSTPSNATSYLIQFIARREGDDDWAVWGSREVENNTFTYMPAMQLDDGGPWNNCYIQIKAKNSAGTSPDWVGGENNYP